MPQIGTIFDIKKFSIHDGPGIRTTVFLKGCSLRCLWCHNPESRSLQPEIHYFENRCILSGDCVLVCPNEAISIEGGIRSWDRNICQLCGKCAEACPTEAVQLVGKATSLDEIMAEIEKDVIYYDQSGGGVTFSGGEPLQQIDFLAALLQRCKEHKIHTVVDTSGFAAWKHFERILPHTDLFLYDLKLMDDEAHKKFTGVSNQRILENLHKLANVEANITIRIPIIPNINDDVKNLRTTRDFVATLGNIQQIDLLPYHNIATDKYHRMAHVYALGEIQSPSDEKMQSLASQFQEWGFSVRIGG